MRILIDITHPAYLHFYRHVITKLSKAGHVLCITGRDKDILRNLALEYKIDMKFFGAFPESLLGKIALLLKRKIWLYHIISASRLRERLDMRGIIRWPICTGTYSALIQKCGKNLVSGRTRNTALSVL